MKKTNKHYKPYFGALVIITLLLTVGCANNSDDSKKNVAVGNNVVLKSSESNEAFTKDFKTYLVEMIEDQKIVENVKQDNIKSIATTDPFVAAAESDSASVSTFSADSSVSVSGTNLIEQGVDESDLVKSDGRQLYIARQAKISYSYDNVVKFSDQEAVPAVFVEGTVIQLGVESRSPIYPTYPTPIIEKPASVRVMSLDNENADSKEIALIELPDDVSTVLGLYFSKKLNDGTATQMLVVTNVFSDRKAFFYQDNNIRVFSFDISNPEKPEKQWQMEVEGYLHASRSMNGKLYLVSTKYFRSRNFPLYPIGVDVVAENKKLVNDLSIDDIFPATWVNDEKLDLVKAENCIVPNKADRNSASRFYKPSLLTVFTIPIDQPKETKTLCTLESSAEVYVSPKSIYFTKGEYVYSNTPSGIGKSYTVIHKLAFTEDSVAYKSSVRVPGWTGWRNQSFRMSEFNDDLRIVVSDYEITKRIVDPKPPFILPIDPIPENPIDGIPVNPIEAVSIAVDGVKMTSDVAGEKIIASTDPVKVKKDLNTEVKPVESGNADDSGAAGDEPIIQPSPIIVIERRLVHKLYVLRESAEKNGQLDILSQLPNKLKPKEIGKPGEQIYAVRFFGNYAYIVTFLRTDPLYAINLTDPAFPFIEGELSIPGFSEYLHPIGENLLIGVGKDATENGMVKGLKVALFDVMIKSKPNLLNEFVLGNRGSNTALSYDYKAFTILSDNETGLHRLTIPVSIYNDERQSDFNNFTYYNWSYSGLQLFEVDDGSVSGNAIMTDVGVLKSHVRSKELQYNYVYQPRSLIVNDALHYVENAKVWSAKWETPDTVTGPN